MQKINFNKKFIFYLCVYAVVILEIIVVVPLQIKQVVNINTKIAELKKKTAQFNRDLSLKETAIQEKNKMQEYIAAMEGRIATAQDTFTISAYISDKAKMCALDIKEIVPGLPVEFKTTPEGKFMLMPFKIQARASYHNLGQFLAALENGGYILAINELSLREALPYHMVTLTVNALVKETL
jgi:Tfp pilus assembly protein PilO